MACAPCPWPDTRLPARAAHTACSCPLASATESAWCGQSAPATPRGRNLPRRRVAARRRASPGLHASATCVVPFSSVCIASHVRNDRSGWPAVAPRGRSSAAASGRASRRPSPDVRDIARAAVNRSDARSPLHDGRVDDYAFHARGLDHAGALCRFNRLCQQSSTPASPSRLRQRVRLDGSIGGSVCR
ncbi:hypothetical protein DR64_1447 [Paraburkholderia xenovorans LB400]|nr:hypothetical protein DR64_1447 [Paraburkholderia xenovorans LB400]